MVKRIIKTYNKQTFLKHQTTLKKNAISIFISSNKNLAAYFNVRTIYRYTHCNTCSLHYKIVLGNNNINIKEKGSGHPVLVSFKQRRQETCLDF